MDIMSPTMKIKTRGEKFAIKHLPAIKKIKNKQILSCIVVIIFFKNLCEVVGKQWIYSEQLRRINNQITRCLSVGLSVDKNITCRNYARFIKVWHLHYICLGWFFLNSNLFVQIITI